MYHCATSLKNLQDKIDIIKALKSPSTDSESLKMPIAGTRKNLVINIRKMLDAISIERILTEEEKEEEEKKQKENDKKRLRLKLPYEDIQYIDKKLEDFELKKTEQGTLDGHSMMKVLKIIGDFAKAKNEKVTKEAQAIRLQEYGKDDDNYIDAIRDTLSKEERNYSYCTNAVLTRLKITPEVFAKSEAEVFSNPSMRLNLMHSENSEEEPEIEIPGVLTKSATIEIIEKANDVAFDKYKELHHKVLRINPELTPIMVSCLSHDYIYDVYGYPEEVFKAAMYRHKVFEDYELAAYMQDKQYELMHLYN